MTRRAWIALAVIVAGIVAVNVFGRSDRRPHGPASSSYATSPAGAAAYAELLERVGYRVRKERASLAEHTPDPRETLVVLDPGRLSGDDTSALIRFANRGGRLVAGGRGISAIAATLRAGVRGAAGGPSRWHPGATLPGVREVQTAGERQFVAFARGLPLLVSGERAALVQLRPGRGEVLLLADASALQNRLLAAGDNAQLAVALAGARTRRVVFAESVHGYDEAGGLSALPGRWKAALIFAAVAALLFMLSRARRLGDPEPAARDLDPPRRDHVEAVAASLARTGDRAQTAVTLRAAARSALGTRAALAPDAGEHELRTAATDAGLTAEETTAVVADGDLIVTGRALARLTHPEDQR